MTARPAVSEDKAETACDGTDDVGRATEPSDGEAITEIGVAAVDIGANVTASATDDATVLLTAVAATFVDPHPTSSRAVAPTPTTIPIDDFILVMML